MNPSAFRENVVPKPEGGPNILNEYEQVIRSKSQASYALDAIGQKPPSYVQLTGPVGTAFWPTREPLSAS